MSELKLSSWLFIRSGKNPDLWTTGFYDPNGKWIADYDYPSVRAAADRVHFLNGGSGEPVTVSGYTSAQVVKFLRRVYCLELNELTEFLTWAKDGEAPADIYVESKFDALQKVPGMFICSLDPVRAEKFLDWILTRK